MASKYQSTKQHVFDNYTNVIQIDKHIYTHHGSHKHEFWVLRVIWVPVINTRTTRIKFKHLE
jgi:hypothetical protein